MQLRRGNPGKWRLHNGVSLPPATLEEPDWRKFFPATSGPQADPCKRMRATARREWRRVVPVLDAQGVLSVVDHGALESYCIAMGHLEEVERALAVEGMIVTDRDGVERRNPLAIIASQFRKAVADRQRSFGLTPSDRRNLPAASPPYDDSHDDVWGPVDGQRSRLEAGEVR